MIGQPISNSSDVENDTQKFFTAWLKRQNLSEQEQAVATAVFCADIQRRGHGYLLTRPSEDSVSVVTASRIEKIKEKVYTWYQRYSKAAGLIWSPDDLNPEKIKEKNI